MALTACAEASPDEGRTSPESVSFERQLALTAIRFERGLALTAEASQQRSHARVRARSRNVGMPQGGQLLY